MNEQTEAKIEALVKSKAVILRFLTDDFRADLRELVETEAGPLRAKLAEADGREAVLLDLLYTRRAIESKHSREDHECPECEALADLRHSRKVAP